MKGTCDESEIEVEVSDSSHSCFSDAGDTKTIDIGDPDWLLENLASLKALLTCWLWCWKWIR